MSGRGGFAPHERAAVVAAARAWIGTPYHHQAALQGVGADCLGLVRGVYRELYGREAAKLPGYSRDWAEASGNETMLNAARQHLIACPKDNAGVGDVVIFRWRAGMAAKHAGVLTGVNTMVHAMEGGPVCEVALSPWWCRRIAGVFSFPGTIS